MNDRIRELAEQASITTNLDTDFFEKDPNKWVDYYSEKFAELIVKECFKAAMIEAKGHMNPIDLMKRMKERVGVEDEGE